MTDEKQTNRKPTPRQIKAAILVSENIGKDKPAPMGEVLREAGYSESVSETPALVLASPTFQDLLEQYMPDKDLVDVHKKLLKSRKLDHMVFPTWKDPEADMPLEGDPPEYLEEQAHGGALKRHKNVTEGSTLTDEDIAELLSEVNCVVRKIVHGETARHVYFWADDSQAQQKALELAYKMRGLVSNKPEGTNTINFIKNAHFNSSSYVRDSE